MTNLRLDDGPDISYYQRNDRIFCDSGNGLWYFRTREGTDIGPFRYRNEAELMLQRFITELQANNRQAATMAKLHFRLAATCSESGTTGQRSW